MKRIVVAVVYLLGLWAYQFPRPAAETAFTAVLHPIQKVTFTDRRYWMDAPDPPARRNIPILLLKTTLTPIRFFKNPPGRGELNFLSRVKWQNFTGNLVTAQTDEGAVLSPMDGWEFFSRLAARICKDESDFGDRVLSVSLQARPVRFERFQEDIAWGAPNPLGDFSCH